MVRINDLTLRVRFSSAANALTASARDTRRHDESRGGSIMVVLIELDLASGDKEKWEGKGSSTSGPRESAAKSDYVTSHMVRLVSRRRLLNV